MIWGRLLTAHGWFCGNLPQTIQILHDLKPGLLSQFLGLSKYNRISILHLRTLWCFCWRPFALSETGSGPGCVPERAFEMFRFIVHVAVSIDWVSFV